jgi:predicted XRE-type DNA-binding protein
MELDKEVIDKVDHLVKFYSSKFFIRKTQREDILQDVYLKLLTSGYLKRYDGSRPLHNYLSGFVYNHFCKVYKVENYDVEKAASIYNPVAGTDNLMLLDTLEDVQDEDVSFYMYISNIHKLLLKKFGFSSFVLYNRELVYLGKFSYEAFENFESLDDTLIFTRSPAQVFSFIMAGMSQADIKEILLVSKSWVSKIVKRISELEELQEFAESKGVDIHARFISS